MGLVRISAVLLEQTLNNSVLNSVIFRCHSCVTISLSNIVKKLGGRVFFPELLVSITL
jgi:hypothetical protein